MTKQAGYTNRWVGKDRISALLRTLQDLDDSSSEIGYFPDSGTHPSSGLSFAAHMSVHELRPASDPMHRPVFGKAVQVNGDRFEGRSVDKVVNIIHAAARGRSKQIRPILDDIGKEGVAMIEPIFGSSHLKPNSPKTIELKGRNEPMVDDGDLRDALSFRTNT
jgi:hypothetical protein